MSKVSDTHYRPGAGYFLNPQSPSQRQYEALRAYLIEGLSAEEAGGRFGYTPATLYSLCRELRAGRLQFFPPVKLGPKKAPKKDAARSRVIELRKRNYSVYDIRDLLRSEGLSLSHVLISQILAEEGFAKLPRRADDERPLRPQPDVAEVADVGELDWKKFAAFETEASALFVLLPTLIDWGIHRWVSRSGLPGSKMIPALQSVLSLLSLKLVGKERISHVMDICFDPGFALFAGINVPPKTTALSTYTYRVTRDMTASLLENYAKVLSAEGLMPGQSFNLDFHAIPHRGEEAVLEKHYVSKRSRAERALLAFLVQDNDSQMLCYANATVRKEDAAEEILNFVDFWERLHGKRPPHLVFDSRLTTYEVLNRLDKHEILFITLRRRGPAVMRTLHQLPQSAWTRMTLKGVSRRYKHVHTLEDLVPLRGLDRPLRQIAVRGLGHEEPTLFLTNDMQSKSVVLVQRYARRMLIENSIAENVDFFHLDALSSAVAFQVDLDVMLTLIANALYRQLGKQLTGFETAKPKQIFRRFLNTPARVTVSDTEVRVRIRRCSHHPILLASGVLNAKPTVPWWNGRRLHLVIR